MFSRQDEATNSAVSTASPTLLAWSSMKNNQISIVELETKQKLGKFDGVFPRMLNGIVLIFHIHV